MAIFGENASGKSTITDAIEWFLSDKVGHLWREDCKKEALRNLKIDEKQESYVKTELNKQGFEGTRKLSPKLKSQIQNKSPDLDNYLDKTTSERLILRNADLTTDINKTKSQKKDKIADIIGYEKIIQFRNTIQSTLNTLQKETSYTTAKQIYDSKVAELFKLAGKVVQTEKDFYKEINSKLSSFNLNKKANDKASYKACILELNKGINQEEKAKKKIKLQSFKEELKSIELILPSPKKYEKDFLLAYESLIKEKEKIKQLNLEGFLKMGKEILEGNENQEEECPFCGNEIKFEELQVEITKKLLALKKNREEFEKIKTQKDSYVSSLNEVGNACFALKFKWEGLNISDEFKELVLEFCTETSTLSKIVVDNFNLYGEIKIPELREKQEEVLLKEFGLLVKKVEINEKALKLTEQQQKIVDANGELASFRKAFFDYQDNLEIKQMFEEQISSLSFVFEEFKKVQNKAMQEALNRMSEDIGKFYSILHPEENVDSVRLAIVGEEGVEFEYSFEGKTRHPPMKYLSESHLNSLGIALFLSSVKLFNVGSNYFILDDVVTSLDIGHRRRIIRLLRDEFRDWQVILLTHEYYWFELIKKELGPEGWIFNEVRWDNENGILLDLSPQNLRDLIEKKRKSGESVGNDLRKLLERLLKEVCESLEVKVAYRSNERNEERMSAELLNALRGTINKKCVPLKQHQIYSKLEADNLIGTKESHDRPEAASLGDVYVILEDIDEFQQLFECGACKTFVSTERDVSGQDKILCKCGKKELSWKI